MERLVIEKKLVLQNLTGIRKHCGVQMIGVLDEDGFGIGAVALANMFVSSGVQILAVTDVKTAKEVNDVFPGVTMLLLSEKIGNDELKLIGRNGVVATVASVKSAEMLDNAAEKLGCRIKVHVLFRTSPKMRGISPARIPEAIRAFKGLNSLEFDGAYTYFPSDIIGKEKKVVTANELFNTMLEQFSAGGIKFGVVHAADSYGAMRYPSIFHNAVRIGSAAAGRLELSDKWKLAKVGKLETEITDVFTLESDETPGIASKKPVSVAEVLINSSSRLIANDRLEREGLIDSLFGGIKALWKDKKLDVYSVGNSGKLLLNIGKNDVRVGDTVRFEVNPMIFGSGTERVYE